MKIQSYNQPPRFQKKQLPSPENQPEQRAQRADAFYRGASGTAAFISTISGLSAGASTGIKISEALIQGLEMNAIGAGFVCVVGMAGGAVAGGILLSKASDFVGKLGADLDSHQPQRGEALARNAFQAGFNLLNGNGVGFDLALAGGVGALNYALHRPAQ